MGYILSIFGQSRLSDCPKEVRYDEKELGSFPVVDHLWIRNRSSHLHVSGERGQILSRTDCSQCHHCAGHDCSHNTKGNKSFKELQSNNWRTFQRSINTLNSFFKDVYWPTLPVVPFGKGVALLSLFFLYSANCGSIHRKNR